MINIINAQIYKLIHNKVIFIAMIVSCILSGLTITDLLDMKDTIITGSIFACNNAALPMATIVFLGIAITIIAGNDFIDKTINYEILSGHKKKEIYFGRFVVASIVGILGSMIIINIMPIIFTILNGWGDRVSINGYILRNLFSFIVILKIICLITMVCFLMKNSFASCGVLFVLFYIEFIMNILQILPKKIQPFLTMSQLTNIFLYNSDAVSKRIINQSIIISILEGCIFIFVGLVYFSRSDMQ